VPGGTEIAPEASRILEAINQIIGSSDSD